MLQSIALQAIKGNPLKALLFGGIQHLLSKVYDPLIQYELNGKTLSLPFSNPLPQMCYWMPAYSQNMARLAHFVRLYYGKLAMVDVGANIGDSFCLAGGEEGDSYLLVEGHFPYYELLKKNTRHHSGVMCVHALLTDNLDSTGLQLEVRAGTAKVIASASPATKPSAAWTTLDQILLDNPFLAPRNLLKTDVDGYDGRVLRGARRTIEANRPVLFFELYPQCWEEAGDSPRDFIRELEELGYKTLQFYDNEGFFVGSFSSGAAETIHDLLSYIRQRGVYYDVCAFHVSEAAAMNRFVQEEKIFYSTTAGAFHRPLKGTSQKLLGLHAR